LIIINRKLGGIVPYVTVFFPESEVFNKPPVNPLGLARFYWCEQVGEPRNVIKRDPGATVCIDLEPARESLFSQICRNGRVEIRAIERLGEQVNICRNGDSVRDFLSIYQEFARNKEGVAPLNEAILARYRECSDVFLAYLDGNPLCGHVFLRDRSVGRVRMLYSASKRLDAGQNPRICSKLNRFLHWYELQLYKDEGFKTYDFGGISDDPRDGIADFKKSFGGEVRRECSYTCAGSPLLSLIARPRLVHAARELNQSLEGRSDSIRSRA
jgi:hypothetical protein